MKRIFLFIWKNYFFFLFVILEFLAFTLMFQSNHFHRAKFVSSSNAMAASITGTVNNITDYFRLKKINKELAKEIAELRSRDYDSFKKLDKLFYEINDTLYRQKYSFVSAKVINNSVNRRNNYLTLNKGALHGIKPEMGVITNNGIVGIVKNVSNNYSSVISILHKDTKISVKIKKNGYVGSLAWDGMDYRTGTLQDIPSHVELSEGDTIITSGYSAIFPEGIMVGKIVDYVLSEGDSFFTIEVKFTEDYKNLSYVYVVRNLLKYEQKELEETSRNE